MRKLLMAMVLLPLMALADIWTDPETGIEWGYTISDGQAEVGRSEGVTGAIIIPSMLGGSPVTSIGPSAFQQCSELTSVTIPEGVTSIGRTAFAQCSELTSVTISSSVTKIGDGAFNGTPFYENLPDGFVIIGSVLYKWKGQCPSAVEIPSGVTRIGRLAFSDCGELTSVTISSSVTLIEASAFHVCGLKDVYFKGVNPPSVTTDSFQGCDPDLVLHAPKGWRGRTRILGGVYLEVEGEFTAARQVNVTTTNIIVNYIFNSVQPEFVKPVVQDVGFVNIVAEVKGGCVAVPMSWAENYPNFTNKFGTDFTAALGKPTGKVGAGGTPMFVWQDYVAGTDPTIESDVFAASVTFVDGKVTVSYSPELDAERKAMRKYTTWGKKSLLDATWTAVPSGDEAEYNFFKVSVEMK